MNLARLSHSIRTRGLRHSFRLAAARIFPPQLEKSFVEPFRGRTAFEIGGPSALFRTGGLLPVYEVLREVDGCNFGSQTVWEGDIREGQTYRFQENRPAGRQFILEATDLSAIESSSCEALISSHTLEHTANPVAALKEWLRVLRTSGLMLIVLPHRDGAFDRRRPVTSLAHILDDYRNGTSEADTTHVEEILRLHDLALDPAAGAFENFKTRAKANMTNRCLHHHVFDSRLALEVLDSAGVKLLACAAILPASIVVLCEKTASAYDNRAFLVAQNAVLRASPFSTDRVAKPFQL